MTAALKHQTPLLTLQARHSALRSIERDGSRTLKAAVHAGYDGHGFNQYLSDQLGYTRRTKDTRRRTCLKQRYPPVSTMPDTSVIIVFHNEALSTLGRTVQSVLLRTHLPLLREVLLVDDGSSNEELNTPQMAKESFMQSPLVRMVTLGTRQARARATSCCPSVQCVVAQ